MGTVRILYPRRPVIPASVLLAPVRCIEGVHELSEKEMLDVFSAVKKLNSIFKKLYTTTGYNLFVNTGESAGQHIPHVHFHVYGRSENETISPFDILNDAGKHHNRDRVAESDYRQRIENIRNSL